MGFTPGTREFIDRFTTHLPLLQGWGQIRLIKYKYKYKYKNLDFQIQIQIQIFSSTLIQIQIQIHRFKYKYKYVQPNTSAETVQDPKQGNSINPKIYAHGLCFLMFR